MKTIIYISLVLFYLPAYSQNTATTTSGGSGQQQGTNLATQPAQTVQNQGGAGAQVMAAELIDGVYGGANQAGQITANIQNLNNELSAGISSFSQLNQIVGKLQQMQDQYCAVVSERSVQCCTKPKESGCASSSWADKASMGIQALGTMAAVSQQAGGSEGGGAASQGCLDSLNKLAEASEAAGGGKQACQQLRSGGRAVDDQGRQYQVPGCTNICQSIQRTANNANQILSMLSTAQPPPSDVSLVSTVTNNLNKINKEASDGIKHCQQGTAQGENSFMSLLSQMAGTAMSLFSCYTNLTKDPEAETVDPMYDSSFNPVAGITEPGTSFKGGSIGAVGTPGVDSPYGDDTESVPDADVGGNGNNSGKTAGNGNSNNAQGNPFFGGGGMGAGGTGDSDSDDGSGSASYASKTDDLIGGYKGSKSSGGGSGGYGNGSRKGGFKAFGLKPEKKKDAKALAALTEMMKKKGISLDISESIFVRITNRFVNSSAKEKLYDARKSQKLWMNK